MSIPVTCPECDASYRVADTMAGRTVKCKECGEPLVVAAADEDDDRAARSQPKKGGSGKVFLLVAGGLLVLLVVCGGGLGLAGWFGYKTWTDTPVVVAAKDAPIAPGPMGMPKGMPPPMKDRPFKNGDFPPFPVKEVGPIKNIPKKDSAKPVVAGTFLLDQRGILRPDPVKELKNEKAFQAYAIKLEANKAYVIDMMRDKAAPGYDPYLTLLGLKGEIVAQNDDGGDDGRNARIRYTPTVSGEYTIRATAFIHPPDDGLSYRLTVKQE